MEKPKPEEKIKDYLADHIDGRGFTRQQMIEFANDCSASYIKENEELHASSIHKGNVDLENCIEGFIEHQGFWSAWEVWKKKWFKDRSLSSLKVKPKEKIIEEMTDAELELHKEEVSNEGEYLQDKGARIETELFYRKNPECRK